MSKNDRILYLLRFDTSKTLHENKNFFLIEQKKWYERSGFEQYSPTDYDKRELSKSQKFLDKLENVDPHQVLEWGSIISFFFGPIGKIVSLGLDLGNAYLYHKEGKDLEAGLQIALSVIPLGDLVAKIPAVKKYGKKYLEKLILMSSKGEKMTQSERKVWEELLKNNKMLSNETSKIIFKESFKRLFKNYSLPNLVQFIIMFSKKHPNLYALSNLGLQIGGVYYTYYKLASIFGIKNKINQEESKKIIQEYNKNPEKYQEESSQQVTDIFMTVPQERRDSLFNANF